MSKNENFQAEQKQINSTSVDFPNTTEEFQENKESIQLSILTEKEKDAVATLQIKTIQFSPIDLYVTDTEGTRVRTLIRKYLPAGTYQISWYGETDLTAPLVAGLYIIILDANDSRRMLKVALDR
jgi:hypothetical protein